MMSIMSTTVNKKVGLDINIKSTLTSTPRLKKNLSVLISETHKNI